MSAAMIDFEMITLSLLIAVSFELTSVLSSLFYDEISQ